MTEPPVPDETPSPIDLFEIIRTTPVDAPTEVGPSAERTDPQIWEAGACAPSTDHALLIQIRCEPEFKIAP